MAKVKINQLANEIVRQLEMYTDDVKDELDQATDEISKEAVSELKASSPKKTGKYAKNWARKQTKHGYVVYNKAPTYRLTHLLEHGHMNRDGSRTPAKPHIAPVEEKVIKEMTNRTEKAVEP